MSTKLFLITCGLIAIFIFSGNHFGSIPSESIYSKADFSFANDEKPNSNNCPYIQQKNNSSCPYLNGLSDKSENSCPITIDRSECPYLNKIKTEKTCPFLNENYEEGIDNRNNNKKLPKTST